VQILIFNLPEICEILLLASSFIAE